MICGGIEGSVNKMNEEKKNVLVCPKTSVPTFLPEMRLDVEEELLDHSLPPGGKIHSAKTL